MKWALALLIGGATTALGEVTDRPHIAAPFSIVEPLPQLDNGDPAWQNAAIINELAAPLHTTLPTDAARTKVSLLWTKSDLWVRFDCEASKITRLPDSPTKRDLPYFRADCVEVFLDPVGDGKSYVEIQLSPDNGVFDGLYLYTAKLESDPDMVIDAAIVRRDGWFFSEWNMAGLRTAASSHLTAPTKGWTALLAIPAKALLQRLGTEEFRAGMTLRANFVRFDYSTVPGPSPIIVNWAPVMRGRAHHSPAGMGYVTLGASIHQDGE